MVVIRMGLWADLSGISVVQLPESKIKPAAVELMAVAALKQMDQSTYRRIKRGMYGTLQRRLCSR